MTEVNAQIIVTDDTGFRDAIYVPMAEYKQMSVGQVEALKQERLDAYRARLAEAQAAAEQQPEPVAPEPLSEQTAQQLREQLASIAAQLDALAPVAELPAPEG